MPTVVWMAPRGGRLCLAGSHFGPEVTKPIDLHVAAKRYLCAVDADYLAALSPASRVSLSLQGGPMGDDERTKFEGNPFYQDAIRLRPMGRHSQDPWVNSAGP